MSLRKTLVQIKPLRAAVLKAYQTRARLAPSGEPPRIFVNSMPKAGTHLLTTLLAAVPDVHPSWRHINIEDVSNWVDGDWVTYEDRVRAALGQIRDGQYGSGHLRWSRAAEQGLMNADLKSFVVFAIRAT